MKTSDPTAEFLGWVLGHRGGLERLRVLLRKRRKLRISVPKTPHTETCSTGGKKQSGEG